MLANVGPSFPCSCTKCTKRVSRTALPCWFAHERTNKKKRRIEAKILPVYQMYQKYQMYQILALYQIGLFSHFYHTLSFGLPSLESSGAGSSCLLPAGMGSGMPVFAA